MQNTTVAASFTNQDVIQLRFELGTITDAIATDQIPEHDSLEQGWIWDNGWIGRVQLSGETFMPLDTYNASVLDPLFDAPGGETTDRVAAVDDLTAWSVTVNGVEAGIADLSRKSNILDSATVGWGQYEFRTLQNVFLDLETPLVAGDQIEISFDDPAFDTISTTYDPGTVVSEAIHVNLTGYDPDDGDKTAYLSSWNGWSAASQMTVAQNYDGPLTFKVVNAATGAVALEGETTLGTPANQNTDFERNYALTDVWEMDLSSVTDAGVYYIDVEGVGRSTDFEISDTVWTDVFQTSFSGFYHQRSGIALDAAYTDWTRDRALHPEDGRVTVYASDLPITETDESYNQSKPDQFGPLVAAATDEVLEDAWGGWHDAGDWDRRTQHLEASRKLTDLVEIAPEWAESVQAQIPENTNDLPDLLDEGLWNLEFFARLQTAEGGVRGGIEGDSYRGYGANSAEEVHPLYAYAPDTWTTWEFAASAAKMSRVIEAYDTDAAALWLDRAERAMAWAEARVPVDIDVTQATSRNLAAVELYAATEDAEWHDLFLATSSYTDPNADLAWNEYQFEAAIAYNRLEETLVDADVAGRALAGLQGQAEFLLNQGTSGGFGFIADPYAPYGWGITASQPYNASKFMVALHDLTGDDRYLQAIQGDVQYGLGANPMNMAFMTGLDGVRGPEIILNADADTIGGTPPPGITLYGDYNIYDYGQHPAYGTMWNEVFPNAYETPVHESFNGYYLFVPSTEYTVQQGITDMTYATGYLAAHAGSSEGGDPVEEPPTPPTTGNEIPGTDGNDRLTGTSGNDLIVGMGGADRIDAGAGDDIVIGGAGNDYTLRGGTGADAFGFGIGSDVDRVLDFEDSIDVIQLLGGLTFADLLITGFSVNGTEHTNVFTDAGDRLVLLGVSVDQIEETDFTSDTAPDTGGGTPDTGGDPQTPVIDSTIAGTDGNDRLTGTSGNDLIDGMGGADRIDAGAGSDIVIGGAGNDYNLRGGADADTFGFGTGSEVDRVLDFEDSIDVIQLLGGVSYADLSITGFTVNGTEHTNVFIDTGDRLVLLGVSVDQIDQTDFLIA